MPTGADAAALSGMQAAGYKMTSIGNNVSNADTVGYKKEQANFYTIVAGLTSSTTFASGGVGAIPLRQANEQGLLSATTSGTDIAVSGNGFFVVGKLGGLQRVKPTHLPLREPVLLCQINRVICVIPQDIIYRHGPRIPVVCRLRQT